ncbi:MAG: hypothetical protein IKE04_02800 [Oscillospiraceae bacterium]|nr:hypothetical protein [Oscillospiraceae bacterium]
MAIRASASVTLAAVEAVERVTRWYLLQASTASVPAKPTANPPGGSWVNTEPAFSASGTNTLYTAECTEFTDSSFYWSDVSVSSSYEAAKAAYNRAIAAGETADAAQEAAEQAQAIATDAQQELTAFRTETGTAIRQLQDAIALRVTETQYTATQQAIRDRLTEVELRTGSVETTVQGLQDGVGTHFIVEDERVRITQDQTGEWEQQLYADRMAFVGRTTGKVAASFGVNGGYADRLRSNKELSVGETETGWYDMTSLESGVADKWRDGGATVKPPIITLQTGDCLLDYVSGSHPITGTTNWPESAGFTIRAENAESYQWQYRYGAHDTWRDSTLTGARTDTIAPFRVKQHHLTLEWRCAVTGGGTTVYTRGAHVRFERGPGALAHPESVTGAASGESVTLTVIPLGAASLQWQSKSSETGSWANISGETGTSLTVTAGSAKYYRLVMTDSAGRVATTDECVVSV